MVTFKDKSFVIEVTTGCNPVSDWLQLCEELLDVLSCTDTEIATGTNFAKILFLLREMQPDHEIAKKMTI
jgi:hypothetical protein